MYILSLPLFCGGLVIPFQRKIISFRTHYAFSNLRIFFSKMYSDLCPFYFLIVSQNIHQPHQNTTFRVFPDLPLFLAVHYIYRYSNEVKQHRADSLPLSHYHGDKANTVKFGSQQCWDAWHRIHFRSISLNSHSPLRRCLGAQSPASPQARMKKGLAITRKRSEARQLQ